MARIVKEEEYKARRNEILDQLHMSKGAFYHYFDSKVAVLEAVIERMATEQVKPIFLSIVQNPQLPALEKLHQYFYMSTSWKTTNRALLTELMQIWYSDENALVRQKILASTVENMGPIFTEIIKQGVREGVFSTPYPEV